MGDDLLELAKAKELASIMGGAWHTEEVDDSDSGSEQTGNRKVNNRQGKYCETIWTKIGRLVVRTLPTTAAVSDSERTRQITFI